MPNVWFSYVYIAAVLHEDSWEIDSELLVQQAYREELYDASEYANLYRVYLEEEIGEKILLLENQANALSKEGADFGIEDWTAERDTYVQEGGTTVSGYMATVIAAMEAAMDEDSGKGREPDDACGRALQKQAPGRNRRSGTEREGHQGFGGVCDREG